MKRHRHQLGYGRCRPIPHTQRITQDAVEELRRVYREFNELVKKRKIPPSNIHCMDETGLSCSEEDAAHGKVLHRAGSTPFRRVKKCTQKVTLAAMITADGSTLPPAVLHSQDKNLQQKQVDAWNSNSGEPNSHHLLPSMGSDKKKKTTTMNSWCFQEINERWQEMMKDGNHVVLMDGYGAHYNPRTMLDGRFERGGSGERPRPGGSVFYVVYPPGMTGSVAPCDDRSVFGAFKRNYYRRLSDMGGAKNLEEIHKAAGGAYKDIMTPNHIKKAFVHCGFGTSSEAKENQEIQIANLQRSVDAQQKLAEQSRSHDIIGTLSRHEELGDASPHPGKKFFGEGGKIVGVINEDDNIDALVANMKSRAEEARKKTSKKQKEGKAKKAAPK